MEFDLCSSCLPRLLSLYVPLLWSPSVFHRSEAHAVCVWLLSVPLVHLRWLERNTTCCSAYFPALFANLDVWTLAAGIETVSCDTASRRRYLQWVPQSVPKGDSRLLATWEHNRTNIRLDQLLPACFLFRKRNEPIAVRFTCFLLLSPTWVKILLEAFCFFATGSFL